jgi:hypothetical protein
MESYHYQHQNARVPPFPPNSPIDFADRFCGSILDQITLISGTTKTEPPTKSTALLRVDLAIIS